MMDLIWSEELEPIIQILQQRADVTADEAGEIFTTIFIFAHGYASMFANNEMTYDENLLVTFQEIIFITV